MRREIFEQLKNTDGFVSGEILSASLGVTRAALWKHIKAMKADGANIDSVASKGYRLIAPPGVPRAEYVTAYLHRDIPVIFKPRVTSTNDVAKVAAQDPSLDRAVFITAEQTAGKGRKGRTWISPKGSGLYMSFLLRPTIDPALVSGLTLMAAVALSDAIQQAAGIETQIKWPNDILIDGKKAAGILTESLLNMDGIDYIVCGIGINVHQRCFDGELADTATSLSMHAASVNTTMLAATLIDTFLDAADVFEHDGLAPFMPAFTQRSAVSGRVTVISPGHRDTGDFAGYGDDGALLLDCSGEIKRFIAGEVSLRGENGYV